MAIPEVACETDGKADADRGAAGRFGRRSGASQVPNWYLISIFLLGASTIATFFYWAAAMVAFPYELDYGEGIVIWQVQHVSRLAAAYKPITQYPYIVFHYPPLYHFVTLAFSKATRDLLFAGRLVSMLSSMGICLVLASIVYLAVPRRFSRRAAIGAAVFTATLPCGVEAMAWAPLMRVDMFGLLLTFTGLGMFVLARSNVQRYGALILLVAAMYTRQTLIAGALACLLTAAILDLSRAVRMAAFTVALGAAVLVVLSLATHGEVVRHIFLYNRNRYSLYGALMIFNFNMVRMLPLLALACVAAYGPIAETATALSRRTAARLRARCSISPYRLAIFIFTVHFVISGFISLTAGKRGSDINYFLEWDLSACVLAGLLVARLLWNWRKRRVSAVAALAYLLPLVVLGQSMDVPVKWLQQRDAPVHLAGNFNVLMSILRNSPEPVMSEDMTLLYKAGKQVPFEPAIVGELAATGQWDPTPLVNMVRKRAFSVMLIKDLNMWYPPAVADAIQDNYTPTARYGQLIVYRPLDGPSRLRNPAVGP
jgi:hypothetical protein